MLTRNKINLIIILFIAFILFFLNYLRFNFDSYNYFDQAIYINQIFHTVNNKWWMAFFGHYQPLLIPFSLFINLIDSYLLSNIIIIFFKCIVIVSPLIINYKKNTILLYCLSLSFIIWYNALNNFHIDILILPLSFLYFEYLNNKQFNKAVLILFLFCLIKEIFIIIASIYSIMLIGKINYKKLIFINLFFSIFFIIIYFYLIPQFSHFNVSEKFPDNVYRVYNYDWIFNFKTFYDFNFILLLKRIISIFAILFFYWISFFLANKKYLIISCLILLIFITSDNPNHSSIVNHYFLPLVAPMFYALNNCFEKYKNKSYFKKEFIIIYVFLMHITISPSPLSFSFYSNVNKYFNYQQYLFSEIKINEKKFIFEKLKKLDKKKTIVASNNANFSYLSSFYNYLPYPAGIAKNFYLPKDISFFEFIQIFLNKENIKVIKLIPDIVIIRKSDKWIYDEKINMQNTHNNDEYMNNLENNNFVKHILSDLVMYEKK